MVLVVKVKLRCSRKNRLGEEMLKVKLEGEDVVGEGHAEGLLTFIQVTKITETKHPKEPSAISRKDQVGAVRELIARQRTVSQIGIRCHCRRESGTDLYCVVRLLRIRKQCHSATVRAVAARAAKKSILRYTC